MATPLAKNGPIYHPYQKLITLPWLHHWANVITLRKKNKNTFWFLRCRRRSFSLPAAFLPSAKMRRAQ
jgi:hypothetical protein